MTRGPVLRWVVLLGALGVAAWLAVFGDKTPPGVVQPPTASSRAVMAATQPASGRAAQTRNAPPLPPVEALVDRATWPDDGEPRRADLFAPAPWMAVAPPPVAAPPAPEAPPPPPALPAWRVVGKQRVDDQWEVFLMKDTQSLVVRQGQVLEGVWRVDRIEPPNMTITHVPSNQQHQLSIGEAT